MKGRDTTLVSIRLPDSVYTTLKERAKGLSVAEYLKKQILHSVDTTGGKLKAQGSTLEGNRILGIVQEDKVVGLHQCIESSLRVPLYDPAIPSFELLFRSNYV